MSRRMELLCGCSPATDVCISQNFTILDSGMYIALKRACDKRGMHNYKSSYNPIDIYDESVADFLVAQSAG